jgi:hypothetical protein
MAAYIPGMRCNGSTSSILKKLVVLEKAACKAGKAGETLFYCIRCSRYRAVLAKRCLPRHMVGVASFLFHGSSSSIHQLKHGTAGAHHCS